MQHCCYCYYIHWGCLIAYILEFSDLACVLFVLHQLQTAIVYMDIHPGSSIVQLAICYVGI